MKVAVNYICFPNSLIWAFQETRTRSDCTETYDTYFSFGCFLNIYYGLTPYQKKEIFQIIFSNQSPFTQLIINYCG